MSMRMNVGVVHSASGYETYGTIYGRSVDIRATGTKTLRVTVLSQKKTRGKLNQFNLSFDRDKAKAFGAMLISMADGEAESGRFQF